MWIHILYPYAPLSWKSLIWQSCSGMDVRGCLTPSLGITESPNPFRLSGLLVKKHGPIFKTKYKDIFPYLYRDPKTRIKLGGDSENLYLAYSFSKIKILPQNQFPSIFQNKHLQNPIFSVAVRQLATLLGIHLRGLKPLLWRFSY